MDFLLSRDFYLRAHARVNKTEAMYEVLPVPRTFTFTRDLLYIASILFTHAKNTRLWKFTLQKLLTYNYKEKDYIHLQ